jgi:hypothetical protein
MTFPRFLAPAALALLGAVPAAPCAQGIGTKMPVVELEGYSQTSAQSFEDFHGRGVLIEFFAYW